MDQNSPVTDTILSVLAELLAKADPEQYENQFASRLRIDREIEHLSDGVVPYDGYEDGQAVRERIEERLESIERQIAAVRVHLSKVGGKS